MIRSYLWVAMGSALGGVARVAISSGFYRREGTSLPWGTLVVNVLGCFLLGILFSWAEGRFRLSSELRLFLMVGFCGGFTTFSTFALDTFQLIKSGGIPVALVYALGSAVLGVSFFFAGFGLGRAL